MVVFSCRQQREFGPWNFLLPYIIRAEDDVTDKNMNRMCVREHMGAGGARIRYYVQYIYKSAEHDDRLTDGRTL